MNVLGERAYVLAAGEPRTAGLMITLTATDRHDHVGHGALQAGVTLANMWSSLRP